MAGNLTGRKLNNRYLIGERIGVGGMAEVYQGQDTVLGRTVAVKVMLPQYAEDAQFTTRFRQEAASAANLQSPYIVNVYDWGQDANTSFIVMEFVRGSDLKTAVTQRGPINQRKVAEIGAQVCQALSVAHGLDIIHRDIKPQNIMVQPDGNVKVMDFGIARAKNSVMAKTGAVLGTAHYISPEQAQGKELSPASDIYSLGVVMYEAVTGQLPFDGPDAVSVAMKQVNDEPAPPREINPQIDPNLEAIILKAMSKNPEDRFATANDMRHCLNDFLAGRPVNVGGFSGAQTAVLAGAGAAAGAAGAAAGAAGAGLGADATAVMNSGYPGDRATRMQGDPRDPRTQGDRTAVMNPSDMNGLAGAGGAGAAGAQQRNYRNVDPSGQNKSGKRTALVAIGAIAVIAVIAILSWVLLGQGCSARSGIEVPDLAGKTLSEAQAEIEKAGFELGTVDYTYSETVEADKVISQTPRAGTFQEAKTKVTLVVSQGVEQVTVPDLSDMTASEARSALQKVGLKYEAGTAEHSDTVAENHVLRQEPKSGEKVAKGSTVTYILSAGMEQVSIPNVVGKGEGEARTELTNAGFTVTVDYQASSAVAEGLVISQSPSANEKAKSGSSVNIVVSTGANYFDVSASVSDASGGSVTPTYLSVQEGGSVTFNISTNAGYTIASVSDSNGNSYGTSSSVTLSNIQGSVYLYVEFASTGGGGSSSSAASGASTATA